MAHFEVVVPASELNLPLCVSCGQVFRWRQPEAGVWVGVDGPFWFRVALSTDVQSGRVRYAVESNGGLEDFERLFRLDSRLSDVEARILQLGPELAPYVARLPGLRVLQPSDPEEVLFCFLCTPNNNLERILRMVSSLAEYGAPIEGSPGGLRRFPTAEAIAEIPETELRSKGFGYRGATIPSVARQVLDRPAGWLASLKGLTYQEAHAELCRLKGVGPKLADCIALFGLHHLEAVPVDTHLWQAAVRLYFPELAGKSLTDARYQAIGDHFRYRFGALAGWAHQYLFYENLLRWRERGSHNP